MTTTTLDFVSHDLEMMMPGSQLMLTGGGGSAYQSVGGMAPPGVRPPGPQSGMMPPMNGPPMAGFPNPNSPYPRQWSSFSKFPLLNQIISNIIINNQNE